MSDPASNLRQWQKRHAPRVPEMKYRPHCVALLLILDRFTRNPNNFRPDPDDGLAGVLTVRPDDFKGFFINVECASLARFWCEWPAIALQSAARTGAKRDALTATAAMLHDGLAKDKHRTSLQELTTLAQAAIWHFAAEAKPAARLMLQRGDFALKMVIEETSRSSFDIHYCCRDLRLLPPSKTVSTARSPVRIPNTQVH
jgi:hypothetical protein